MRTPQLARALGEETSPRSLVNSGATQVLLLAIATWIIAAEKTQHNKFN
ncbi:MAG TPA: hypothetical protein ACFCUY_18885 [Xenococcaceae cyanobacterium]